jgi:hypothetical protein
VQPQLLQAAHDAVGCVVGSGSDWSVASACPAACSSARWRLDPRPEPSNRPSIATVTRNRCSCGGPEVATSW